jgi:pimeloyl-ACP methyl ester carboxylesterase
VPRARPASAPYDRGSARCRLAVSLTKLLIVRDEHGYSSAKLPLYFEWHGKSPSSGPVLLLVHGGGSTIESNWGRLIPALESSRRMLAVELQGHGRTGSGDQAASFEGSADGVAALLEELSAGPVDVLGFSNGGQVGMQLAIRHPRAVRRLIVASAPFRRDGMVDGFWDGLVGATYADLPEPYREADLAVSGDPAHAERMFHLDRELMLTGFADWPDSLVAAITAPTLVVAADRDVVRTEHAALLASRIPNARLLIVPGNHGDYLGELVAAAGDPGPLRRALPFLVNFLDQPEVTTQS